MAKKATGSEPGAPEESASGVTKLLATEALAKLKKQKGASVVMRASDYKITVPRIPTGVFPLDYALGGGYPAGRISINYGAKSGSKTTTYYKVIGNAQQTCRTCYTTRAGCTCGNFAPLVCAFVDIEGTWDAKWAACHGVDASELLLSADHDSAEDAIDAADVLIRTGQCDVLVFDSLAALIPTKEIEVSAEDLGKIVGLQPRLIGSFMRKVVQGTCQVGKNSGNRPTVLLTNQIRMKIGVLFGNPETTPGGNAPGFMASVEVKLYGGKTELDEQTGKPYAVNINYKIEKNKLSPAKMEGDYKMLLMDTELKRKGEPLDEELVVEKAEYAGLIVRSGGYQCLGRTFPQKSLVVREMMADREFSAKLRAATMDVLLKAL